MSDEELAARKKLGQQLRYWKTFQFSGFGAGVLNLEAAIKSLDTPDPFIYARQDYASRWLICKVGSQFKAMFHTAAVWSGSSHMETGNYVPEGQAPPTQIPEGRIQRNASNRCQIDYIIDTRYDKTLFRHQSKFEDVVVNDTAFNKSCKPRRNWQKGDNGYDNTFTFSAQVFVRPYGYDVNKLKNPPYPLHPWVREVVQPTTGRQDYYANPHRPEVWDCTTGTMIRIDKANPPSLQKGDIVWMSFHVEFIIGMQTWATQLTPRHIIRVGTVPSVLLAAVDEGGATEEQEPDYTIQEGATFVMNVDFPMYDEVKADVKLDDFKSNAAVKPVDSDIQTDLDVNTVPGEKLDRGGAHQDVVGRSHSGSAEDPQRSQSMHTEHIDRDMDESDGTLTPPPASPAATTPAESISVLFPQQSVDRDNDEHTKSTVRGVKREGGVGDVDAAPPAKKGRQTGTRRPRNV